MIREPVHKKMITRMVAELLVTIGYSWSFYNDSQGYTMTFTEELLAKYVYVCRQGNVRVQRNKRWKQVTTYWRVLLRKSATRRYSGILQISWPWRFPVPSEPIPRVRFRAQPSSTRDLEQGAWINARWADYERSRINLRCEWEWGRRRGRRGNSQDSVRYNRGCDSGWRGVSPIHALGYVQGRSQVSCG